VQTTCKRHVLVVGGVSLHLRPSNLLLRSQDMALAMASNPGTHRNQKPETRPSVLAAAARDRIRNGKRTRQPHKAPAGRLRGCCMMHQAKQTAQPLNLHFLQAVRRPPSPRSPSRRRIGICFWCSTWCSDLFPFVLRSASRLANTGLVN
jgi:hypothetical protein